MNRPVNPDDLVTILRNPDLADPVLLVHFDGWIDAGHSAALAVERILGQFGRSTLATFETEWLLDHRARRPTLHIVDGVNVGMDWPVIKLEVGRDTNGTDVLVLHGAEPDHHWRTFTEAVLGLAQRFGVTKMVGLGAYPAPAPHTRPARVSLTSSATNSADLVLTDVTLDVPGGVESALEQAFRSADIDAMGMWVQVPHYVSVVPYPPAALAIIGGLEQIAGVRFDTADLATEALATRNRLDELITHNDDHMKMLAQLENAFDQDGRNEDLPSSEDLAAEIERFLRSQGDGDVAPAG